MREKQRESGRPEETVRKKEPVGQRLALVVGVRTYPNIPPENGQPLAGCHNDVVNIRETLRGRGFADSNIRVLVDRMESGCDCVLCQPGDNPETEPGLPTRQGILAAVRELIEATGDNDIVVFYFSGHGSELFGRGIFAGQRFQTIVTHDSGRVNAENRDILDLEIEGWIRDFARRTPYLTMIFDCCHSGGVTDLRSGVPAGRQVTADERTEPAAYAPRLRSMVQQSRSGQAPERESRRRGQSGWLRGAAGRRSAIVLSASAAKEYSSETRVEGKKQGLFTRHLTRTLAARDTTGLTWADVFPDIADAVTAENLSQHPRREGSSPVFEPGPTDLDDVYPPDVVELTKLAIVIGIDYQRPAEESDEDGTGRAGFFPTLQTPKRDAQEVARVLEELQGYEIVGLSSSRPGPVLNDKATRRGIHQVINRLVRVKARTQRETAVLIYFAGHGLVRTSEDGEHAGYLVPWDADQNDPGTWLPMKDLRDHLVDGIWDEERLARIGRKRGLAQVTSRHLLLVLDCCFGGAMSFDFFRGGDSPDRPIYYSEYRRFVEGTAWQLLTSASYNQQAMDRDPRGEGNRHSPFAAALIEGLTTDHADSFRLGARSDQIITASELFQYVDSRLKRMSADVQTPGLMALRPLRGQYIFNVPGFRPTPLPDPPLDAAANPWQGEKAYGEEEGSERSTELFYGRERALLELLDCFLAAHPAAADPAAVNRPALAVTGATGSGKTSLVRAGLLPLLADPVRVRRRLRSWLSREQERHLLVSGEDLATVREWARSLSLHQLLDDPQQLAGAVEGWAHDTGLLDVTEPRTAQIQTLAQLESLGMPAFAGGEARVGQRGWLSRLGLLQLLDQPQLLAERLRLWLAEGGLTDFLSMPDTELAGLVGRWRVVTSLDGLAPPGETDDPGLLLVLDPLEAFVDDRGALGEGWQAFAESPRVRTVATVSTGVLQQDAGLRQALAAADGDGRPLWRLYRVPAPSRSQLREIVVGPAAARALELETADLADSLVEETFSSTPAPLALLSLTLSEMYRRAWQRSRGADRQLRAADREPLAAATLLARQAEGIYLGAEDRLTRRRLLSLLLRGVSLDCERPSRRQVGWNELEGLLVPALQPLLQALQGARVLIACSTHVELASDGLIMVWKRLRRAARAVGRRPGGLHSLWSRACEWQQSGFDRSELDFLDPALSRLLRSATVNRLEQAYVIASEMSRRVLGASTLADSGRSCADLGSEWQRSAMLGAALTNLALDTRQVAARLLARQQPSWPGLQKAMILVRMARDRTWSEAEQTMHHLLAATPLSVPLTLPGGSTAGSITGLCFDGDRQLLVRIAEHRAGSQQEAAPGGRVHAWSLDDLTRDPILLAGSELPRAGDGQETRRRPLGDDEIELTVASHGRGPAPEAVRPRAQTGRDGTVRFFAPKLPSAHFSLSRVPVALLGHRGIPTFLAFSRSGRWLATAANLSFSSFELRLWPISDSWQLPTVPETHLDRVLADVLPVQEQAVGDSRLGAADLAGLPATVRVADSAWEIVAAAEDGSSFEIRDLATRQSRTVALRAAGETATGPDATDPDDPFLGLPFLPPPPDWLRSRLPPAPGDSSESRQRQLREIVFSPDGRWLAAGARDGRAWLWSLPDLTLTWSAGGGAPPGGVPPGGVPPGGVPPGGRAPQAGGAEEGGMAPPSGPRITSLAFPPSADSRQVLLAAGTDTGRPWFVHGDGTATAGPERGPAGRISRMVFSPDGERLAIGDLDGTVRLWPARTGAATAPVILRGRRLEGFAVRDLAFDRQGTRLAVERVAVYEPYHGRVDVYRLGLNELVMLACGHAGRGPQPADLPPELGSNLGRSEVEVLVERKEEARAASTEKERYLTALGLR